MKNTRSISPQDTTLFYLRKIWKNIIFEYFIIKISKNKNPRKISYYQMKNWCWTSLVNHSVYSVRIYIPTQLANRTPPSLFNLLNGPSTETQAVSTNWKRPNFDHGTRIRYIYKHTCIVERRGQVGRTYTAHIPNIIHIL